MFTFVKHNLINKSQIPIALTLFLLLVLDYSFLLIFSLLVLILILVYGKSAIILLIILNFLTNQSEYFGNMRLVLNMIAVVTLVYLFLKQYGLEFKKYPKIPKCLIAFVLYLFITLILSTLFSNYPMYGINAMIRTFLFLLLAYIFYTLIHKIQDVYLYFAGIILSFIVIAIRMLVDIYTLGIQDFFIKSIIDDNSKLTGNVGYTNFTVFFISITLLSAFFLLKGKVKKHNFLLISLVILNIITLIFANARAAIFAAILSNIFLFSVLKTKILFRTGFFIISLFVISYIVFPEFQATIDLYLRVDTISQREVFWNASFEIISGNPFFGIGPESFPEYFFTYAPSSLFEFFDLKIWSYRQTPHSTFLLHWVESGILGLLIVIFMFALFFYYSFTVMSLTKFEKEYRIISTAITGLGFGFLFRAFFEVTGTLQYGFLTTDLPFWLLLGIIIHIYQKFSYKNIISRDNISIPSKFK